MHFLRAIQIFLLYSYSGKSEDSKKQRYNTNHFYLFKFISKHLYILSKQSGYINYTKKKKKKKQQHKCRIQQDIKNASSHRSNKGLT